MILNHITPTTSETFDTAFNNACKLIIHDTYHRYYEHYSEGIDTKQHHYDDFIGKAIHGKTLFSLDDIGLILNALINGYNASNHQHPCGKQVDIDDNLDLIIKIYKFITNTDKTRSKMKPFLELYSKQHNSISINNICSLLENNVTWPFANELSPVSMNTLLAKYPANDNWWLERFHYNNNKLTPIQSFDAIRLSRIIDNTNKLDDNDKKALIIKLFTNNLPINICLLDSIPNYYENAFTSNTFTSTRLLVKAFTEFIHCESVESIMVVDDNTAEQCIHDASRFFHSKKNMSILNKSCKGSIIRMLANVINDDTLNDMTRMILFRVLNTIYLVYEHHYESCYDYSYSEIVSINMNIFNLVNCSAVLKNYPEIIHDIIYYPTEYVEESIKNLGSIL